MKVLKFGGTSVGSIESLKTVKSIILGNEKPVIVVVSAFSGVTDELIQITQMAHDHDETYTDRLVALRDRHYAVVDALVPDEKREDLLDLLKLMFETDLMGMFSYLNNQQVEDYFIRKMVDDIVSYGERLSSLIIYSMFPGAHYVHSTDVIKTRLNQDRIPVPNVEGSIELLQHALADNDAQITIMPGFIASDTQNADRITNLGRGGSDFTASIVAAALGAEALEIWTDVDGFMTHDPRTNPEAEVIPRMTYEQAQAMCDAGAKVIYAPTIRPVAERGIPVWVKNTFNPSAPGTIITAE